MGLRQGKARYDYDINVIRDGEALASGPEDEQRAETRFVEECLKLIDAATAIDNTVAAQEIRKRAAGVVNDPRLRESKGGNREIGGGK